MKLTKPMQHTGLRSVAPVIQRFSISVLMLLSLSHCAQFSASQSDAVLDTPGVSEPQRAEQAPPEPMQADGQPMTTDSAALSVKPQPKPQLSTASQTTFEKAKQQLRAADYQAAISLLEPLAQVLPDAAGIQYNLALCYWHMQQNDQARAQLTNLLARQPDYVEAANLLGVIARQEGNFNQARRYWLDALALQSNFASAHKNLGFLYELYLAQPAQARYHYLQYQQLTADPMAEAWLSLLEQQE